MQILRSVPSLVGLLALVGVATGCTTPAPDDPDNSGNQSSSTTASGMMMPPDMEPEHEPAAPFALMEIFTSEG